MQSRIKLRFIILYDRFTRWLQGLVIMPWVGVYVDCPKCKFDTKWFINDTECIQPGDRITVCPKCRAVITVSFSVT
jgi:hypothetical protein